MKLDGVAGFYDKNIGSLKKSFPSIFSQVAECLSELPQNVTVVETSAGLFNLITTSHYGKTTTLYGEQDPVIEAQEIFDKVDLYSCDTLFFVGMGLGGIMP